MRGAGLSIASYRFRTTFRRRWGSYLSLVLLIGLVGGVAMGAATGARRTQSSFSTYLASTHPSDVTISIFGGSPVAGAGPAYSAALARKIAHLPHVRQVRAGIVLDGFPLNAQGLPRFDIAGKVYPVASVDGLLFDQDRVTVVQGRMANPHRPDEIMMPASAAQLLGYHVGQVIPYGFYTAAQESLPAFGTSRVPPNMRVEAKLVGLVAFNSGIVEDDIDRFPTFVVFTPALAKEVLANPRQPLVSTTTYGVEVDGGPSGVTVVDGELAHFLPSGGSSGVHAIGPVAAKADRAVKPIAIALGVFGGVALLAALLIGGQAISRRVREGAEELAVLRALGANPWTTAADGLVGVLAAVVLGSLLAVAVAVALSPLFPLGPVRPVYPDGGIAADWAVLGAGLLILIGGLGAVAVLLAFRSSPHRAVLRVQAPPSSSRVVQALSAVGLPAPGVIGVRMALESGRGRTAVPVRSALVGTALAVALVVATVTYGSSLQTLVNRPPLYGWNWTYMLNQVGTGSAGVPPQVFSLLSHDPDVAAATGVNYNDADLDGQEVPFLFGDTHASITPPILSGHALESNDQIVLGAATMAQLHAHVGGTVVMNFGSREDFPAYLPPTRLTIVGTATMPAVGFATTVSDHTSMGTGALVSFNVLPPAMRKAIASPYRTLNGPSLVFVRLRSGVPTPVGRAGLQRIADAANKDYGAVPGGAGLGNTVIVQGVQRPAEIVNYKTMGAIPALLVAGLAVGAIVALALTLAATVRRRRRDLALLKTLGFTQRQLAAAVAWQSSVAAAIGILIGVPAGIVVGRWLWVLFADQIYAVPEPTVPLLWVILTAIGALVLANVVAAVPARAAARTPTALLLRVE